MKYKIIAFLMNNDKEVFVGSSYCAAIAAGINEYGKAVATILTVVFFSIRIYKEIKKK